MSKRKATPDVLADILAADVSRETPAQADGPILRVPLAAVIDNPWQYRRRYDEQALAKLAANIAELRAQLPATSGLQAPPLARIVRPDEGGRWVQADSMEEPDARVQLATGHRRRRAFDLLLQGGDPEFATLPVIVARITDAEMWRHAMTENTQREDVSAIEEAAMLRQVMDEFDLKPEAAGRLFGWDRSTVANKIRLLQLPEEWQAAMVAGTISEKHGRILLPLTKAWHLVTWPPAEVGAMTTRFLEGQVAKAISLCQPIPATRTGYKQADYFGNIDLRQLDPPAWPLNWAPAERPGIVGACAGCQHRMTFAGESGPRCVLKETHNRRTCYDLKTEAWSYKQQDEQRRAAEELIARAKADADAHAAQEWRPPGTRAAAAPVAAEQGDQVEAPVDDQAPAESQAPAFGIDLSRVSVKAPEDGKQIEWFMAESRTWAIAPGGLVTGGHCNGEKCPCFVLAFNEYAGPEHLRPDPEGAPNMCFGCTSPQRMANRRDAWKHGQDPAERRRQIWDEHTAAEQLLAAAYPTYSGADLWASLPFLEALAKAGSVLGGYSQEQWTAEQLQAKIWWHVAASQASTYTGQKVKGLDRHYRMAHAKDWLRRIDESIGRTPAAVDDQAPAAAEPDQVEAAPVDVVGHRSPAAAEPEPVATFGHPLPPAPAADDELPPDLVKLGWRLKSHGGKYYGQLEIDGAKYTTIKRDAKVLDTLIADCRYLVDQLKLEA